MSERFFGTALERGSGVMETTRLCSSIDDEVSEGTCVFGQGSTSTRKSTRRVHVLGR